MASPKEALENIIKHQEGTEPSQILVVERKVNLDTLLQEYNERFPHLTVNNRQLAFSY